VAASRASTRGSKLHLLEREGRLPVDLVRHHLAQARLGAGRHRSTGAAPARLEQQPARHAGGAGVQARAQVLEQLRIVERHAADQRGLLVDQRAQLQLVAVACSSRRRRLRPAAGASRRQRRQQRAADQAQPARHRAVVVAQAQRLQRVGQDAFRQWG
jgi:hypothetical protein